MSRGRSGTRGGQRMVVYRWATLSDLLGERRGRGLAAVSRPIDLLDAPRA